MFGHATCFQPSKLTLGTAQLGLDYGIANRHGQPHYGEANAILDAACAGGVTTFDTARAYGKSEEVIGAWKEAAPARRVTVVTKLAPLPEGSSSARRTAAIASLRASRAALKTEHLDLVLAHRENDLLQDEVFGVLEEEQASGRIGGIGASVYSLEAAGRLLDLGRISALQVPLSVADRRFQVGGVLDRAVMSGVRVFARSIYLQGALLMLPHELPTHLAGLVAPMEAARAVCATHKREFSEAILVLARDTPGVTSVVVGVERAEQLAPHVAAVAAPALSADLAAALIECFNGLPREIVEPSRWPQ